MKVKIGDTIHDCEDEPIMVILTERDKKNLASMEPDCTRYCGYPPDTPANVVEKFMETG